MKFIIKLMVLLMAIMIGIVYAVVWFMRPPAEYKTFSGPGFSLDVPLEATASRTQNDEWEGYNFTGYANPSIFYYSPGKGTADSGRLKKLAAKVRTAKYTREVPLGDAGIFVLAASDKNSRRYIYIIQAKDRVFWVQTKTGNSTLTSIKDIADRMALTLSADGLLPNPDAAADMKQINREIVLYSQSPGMIMAFSFGIAVLIIIIVLLIILYSGRMPKRIQGAVIRSQSRVYLVTKRKLSYNATLAAIVLTDSEFNIYIFGRSICVLNRNSPGKIEIGSRRNKDFLRIEQNSIIFEVYVSDPMIWLTDISAWQ